MKNAFVVVLCLTMISCLRKSVIINSSNVKSIVVTANDGKLDPIEVTNGDSITAILSKLNNAHKEPIKFYATHKLSINYRDGKQILVLCNGPSMKVEGHTYKLKQRISDILN